MNKAPLHGPDQIPYIISSLRHAVYRFIEDELKKNGVRGLMYTHGAVLFALYSAGGSMRLSDIAALINRTKPTVTVMVDRLEKSGYVKRVPSREDSRVIMVATTAKGDALRDILQATGEKMKRKAFRGIAREDQDRLVELLLKVQGNLAND
ncbi:MAG TPA: MarR family transcriptional regulator [Spirochaetota bacterium]|nr:MarR family transcriptional regulator [Spirochaetota bacterium]